jgi:hypothetical protein
VAAFDRNGNGRISVQEFILRIRAVRQHFGCLGSGPRYRLRFTCVTPVLALPRTVLEAVHDIGWDLPVSRLFLSRNIEAGREQTAGQVRYHGTKAAPPPPQPLRRRRHDGPEARAAAELARAVRRTH